VGITNPHLFRILVKHGMFCAGFSCRAADFGNRRLTNLSAVILRKMKPGDILLLHETIPGRPADGMLWEKEIEKILADIRRREWEGQAMSQILQKPVMSFYENDAPVEGHVAGFYDALAPIYDREQDSEGQRALRKQEKERVLKAISTWVGPGSQVLEIGAGTGRFTLPLARSAAVVTAVDTSREMLAVLERKAAHAGVVNIAKVHADIRTVAGYSGLDAIFAISCLEYVPDLAELFVHIRRMLKPGGILYLTIARRSLLRLAIQVGNALRQGVWLHAWSRGEINRFLASAGFGDTAIRAFGMRSPLCRGILMEVTAKRPDEDGAS
jgi:ubiquinone/menaquinone biosynthesis C-methylase UbiE